MLYSTDVCCVWFRSFFCYHVAFIAKCLPLFRARDLSPDITLMIGEGTKTYVPPEHHVIAYLNMSLLKGLDILELYLHALKFKACVHSIFLY